MKSKKKVSFMETSDHHEEDKDDDDALQDLVHSDDGDNDYEDMIDGDGRDDDDGYYRGLGLIDRKHERLVNKAKAVVKSKGSKLRKGKNCLPDVRDDTQLLSIREPSVLAPIVIRSKETTTTMSASDSLTEKKDKSKKKTKTKIVDGSKLSLRDLASSMRSRATDSGLSDSVAKELTKLAKKKSLVVPLRKPEADLISRQANYEDVKRKTSKKWADIVRNHNTSDHLSFPLPVIESLDSLESKNSSQFPSSKSIPRTEMEAKIESLLSSSENRLDDGTELTIGEEKLLQSLSVEEAKERLAELSRTRALLSYQQMKMKREAKIKSRSYHRIKRKQKLKDALEQFESLKQTDPAAALEQLKSFDKTRALERATLRHRNTGKFAKQAKIRNKYNDETRDALEQQLQIHQKNIKRREFSDDDEDGDEDMENDDNDVTIDRNVDATEVNGNNKDGQEEDFDVDNDYNPWLKVPSLQSLQASVETAVAAVAQTADQSSINNNNNVQQEVKQIRLRQSFVHNPKHDVIDGEEGEGDDHDDHDGDVSNSQRLSLRQRNNMDMIAEAFADDDVVEEFAQERKDEMDKVKEQMMMNNDLPGWGSWTGVDAESLNKASDRKRRRERAKEFQEQMAKKLRLQTIHQHHDPKVMMNPDPGATNHRVKQIPFPFKSVPEFESALLANPIGRTFVPETAFKVLIRPKISTKMGTIIEPMSEDNVKVRGKSDDKKNLKKKKQQKKDNDNNSNNKDKKIKKKKKKATNNETKGAKK